MRHILLLTALSLVLLPARGFAQSAPDDSAPDDSEEALIRSALSAAPPSVAKHATVVDFDQNVLREGTNRWVCMPDNPDVPNNSPMCLDENWHEVIDAWMNERQPEYSGIGISYMLQGDMPVSNTDPFATGPVPGNEWMQEGPPHIMIVVSDHDMLENLPTDPDNGGPWVMWKGTPYAHIMVPTVPREE